MIAWYFILVFILLILSAFFSAADMVYGIVDQDKLKKKADKGSRSAKAALKIAQEYDFSISSILFGNNLVNIFISSICTLIGLHYDPTNGATIASVILTVILIIFGEFFPKSIAKRYNFGLSLAFSYPIIWIRYLFFIFTWPIGKLCSLFGRLFHEKSEEDDVIDEDVLDEMIDEIEESGELNEDEAEIVRGAVDLIDIEAYEIMTPRVDVYAIDIDDNIDDILSDDRLLEFSRIPVYKDTIDNIIGVLPVKRLTKALLKNENLKIEDLMYKPISIPRNYQVIKLLEDFKRTKTHIAVVIDEYGGTEGVITMEDILEEVVGDIFDEMDEVEEEVIETKDGYLVDGSMNIDDFFELIDYKEEFETSYSTVAGFIQELKEGFAKVGDTFSFANYELKVTKADQFTVDQIEVIKLKDEENEDD